MKNFRGPPNLVPDDACLAIAQRNQQQSPLLHLPADIRNRIFGYAIDLKLSGTPTCELSGRSHSDHLFGDVSLWDRLELSRSCRQIFAQTAQSYFERWLLATSKYASETANKSTDERAFEYPITPSHRRVVRCAILRWYDLEELHFTTDKPCALAEMVSLVQVEVESVDDWVMFETLEKMRDNPKERTGKPELKVTFKSVEGVEIGF